MSGCSIIFIFWLFSISHLTSVEQLYIKVHSLSTNSPGQPPLQMERMMKFVQRKSPTPSPWPLLWPLWCVRRQSFDSGLHEGEITLIPNPLRPSHTTKHTGGMGVSDRSTLHLVYLSVKDRRERVNEDWSSSWFSLFLSLYTQLSTEHTAPTKHHLINEIWQTCRNVQKITELSNKNKL